MYKGQLSTEYLVILAIVIVIALVVVAIQGYFMEGSAQSINPKPYIDYWRTAPEVGFMDWKIDENGVIQVAVRNNNPESIKINKIVIDGQTIFDSQLSLMTGMRETICGQTSPGKGQYKMNVTINYTNVKYGTNYKIRGGKDIVGMHMSGTLTCAQITTTTLGTTITTTSSTTTTTAGVGGGGILIYNSGEVAGIDAFDVSADIPAYTITNMQRHPGTIGEITLALLTPYDQVWIFDGGYGFFGAIPMPWTAAESQAVFDYYNAGGRVLLGSEAPFGITHVNGPAAHFGVQFQMTISPPTKCNPVSVYPPNPPTHRIFNGVTHLRSSGTDAYMIISNANVQVIQSYGGSPTTAILDETPAKGKVFFDGGYTKFYYNGPWSNTWDPYPQCVPHSTIMATYIRNVASWLAS